MTGVCDFCSKEKKVEELTIVEIVDFDKFKFVYEQEYIGTILSCRYCRFLNRKPKNLLKVLYYIYLCPAIACCFYNFSDYKLGIGPFYLTLCYLIGMFEFFLMKYGDATFSKSLLPVLVENKLLPNEALEKNARYDIKKQKFYHPKLLLFVKVLFLIAVFLFIVVLMAIQSN
jgi:hypothetical protein